MPLAHEKRVLIKMVDIVDRKTFILRYINNTLYDI